MFYMHPWAWKLDFWKDKVKINLYLLCHMFYMHPWASKLYSWEDMIKINLCLLCHMFYIYPCAFSACKLDSREDKVKVNLYVECHVLKSLLFYDDDLVTSASDIRWLMDTIYLPQQQVAFHLFLTNEIFMQIGREQQSISFYSTCASCLMAATLPMSHNQQRDNSHFYHCHNCLHAIIFLKGVNLR